MAGEITDADLAAALAGRDHWHPTGEDTAQYAPPGMAAIVRVGRIRNPPRTGPTRHDRYYGAVVRDGRALHSTSAGFAAEIVGWAERQRLG